jgi:hypothetical protein
MYPGIDLAEAYAARRPGWRRLYRPRREMNEAGSGKDAAVLCIGEPYRGFLDIALCRRLLFNAQTRAAL